MAVRKIRLTLSGKQHESVGPIVDIDFNSISQDVDHEVTAISGTNTETREYTVDVDAGTYNLDLEYKNDVATDGSDRNLVIERVEIANDGTNYAGVFLTSDNTTGITLTLDAIADGRWRSDKVTDGEKTANPSYDAGQPRTDDLDAGYVAGTHEGSNAKWQYADHYTSHRIFTNGTGTVQLTFT
jgi:hypothetical protein